MNKKTTITVEEILKNPGAHYSEFNDLCNAFSGFADKVRSLDLSSPDSKSRLMKMLGVDDDSLKIRDAEYCINSINTSLKSIVSSNDETHIAEYQSILADAIWESTMLRIIESILLYLSGKK